MAERYFTGEQYKFRYQPELDGVDPLQHYLQYGKDEGREVSFPFNNPAQYLDHPFNADIKADPFWGKRPDLHWLLDGARNKRPYLPETSEPAPSPYLSGLTEVMSFPGDEIFCYWKGWAGTYGLHTGGAKLLYNGQEKQRFDRESIFTMLSGLCTTEFYASILSLENGVWNIKYSRTRRQDLMLGLTRRANGQYVGLWTGWDNGKSGLVYSYDKENWTDGPELNGVFCGIHAEGDIIRLAGKIGTAEAVVNEQGKPIAIQDNGRGFQCWALCWPFVGSWIPNPAYGGYINRINGDVFTQVYDNDSNPHRYIQSMVKLVDGSYLAVATNDWDAPKDKKTLLLKWKLDEKPKQILEIPLPHVMNLFPTLDGGADICGGKYQDFGKVLHWRP